MRCSRGRTRDSKSASDRLADPGVEQLQGLGPGADLHRQVVDAHLGEQVEQAQGGGRVALQQPPIAAELPRAGAALGHVGGQGEGRPGEPDEGDPGGQPLADAADRLGHVAEIALRVDLAEPRQVRGPGHVELEHGSGREGDGAAHGIDGGEDVGEEDGGVDAEHLHRHEGHLGGHRGIPEHGPPWSRCAP